MNPLKFKPVYQTDNTNITGNCLQASVASLLGYELDKVPRFNPMNWERAYVEYFTTLNKTVLFIPTPNEQSLIMATNHFHRLKFYGNCILAVKSFHYNSLHAVVGEFSTLGMSVIHDPNPANKGRYSYEYDIMQIDWILET